MVFFFDQQSTSKTHTRGFTLIELLVVIAIIGILSSLVLASLNTTRSKARDTKRLSEMKQLTRVMELYYVDHKHYPSGGIHDVDNCHEDFPNLSTHLVPQYISSLLNDEMGYCNWYGDYANGEEYFLYYEFEAPQNMPTDCGDGEYGGNWRCTGSSVSL